MAASAFNNTTSMWMNCTKVFFKRSDRSYRVRTRKNSIIHSALLTLKKSLRINCWRIIPKYGESLSFTSRTTSMTRSRCSRRRSWTAAQTMTITRFSRAWRPPWTAFWSLIHRRVSPNLHRGDAILRKIINFHQMKEFWCPKFSMDTTIFVLIQCLTWGTTRSSKLRSRSMRTRTRTSLRTNRSCFP